MLPDVFGRAAFVVVGASLRRNQPEALVLFLGEIDLPSRIIALLAYWKGTFLLRAHCYYLDQQSVFFLALLALSHYASFLWVALRRAIRNGIFLP